MLPLNFDGPHPALIRRAGPAYKLITRYHRHRVEGMQHVPTTGPALLTVHHSFASYDGFLFGAAIGTAQGRYPASLGDDNLFAIPGLRRFCIRCGIVPASPENGRRLLQAGHLVAVAPGGTREALRPTSESRTLLWDRRKGFARLAVAANAPVVPVACPAADDLYTVYENRLTKLVYKQLRFPIPAVRGFGPTLLPRPVELVHHVGQPIYAPSEGSTEARVDGLHAQVLASMKELLQR